MAFDALYAEMGFALVPRRDKAVAEPERPIYASRGNVCNLPINLFLVAHTQFFICRAEIREPVLVLS